MNRNPLAVAAFAVALATTSGAASAATGSVATADVNLRAGPGTAYPIVRVVPQGARVAAHGCLADYSWCDVGYAGARGWVSASYLTTVVAGTTVVVGPRVGLPVVTFTAVYWDRYYASYPWYYRGPAYYGPPRGRTASAGCGPRGCAGTVTGAYGGSASGARGCGPRGCAGAGTVTGPNGGTVSGAHACGPRGCVGGRRVVGPNGGTRTRTGGVRW
ncbi:SH3 domain-containing protein [Aurantimonas sp. 22II-16-19i]|uniref:SH3 domain-containing protein n=1 Tax=Aurantimonas sp. 22II-16-19i TaxID=1317114 RepID=UPI0009F7AD4E|nr:SH3 domain-containing protein [Aurantimonas sp. 22II-16-19i]ORE98154.1 SH3 type 3 domain-containing protein [Aurantimonas sp. 22II-16-19i]